GARAPVSEGDLTQNRDLRANFGMPKLTPGVGVSRSWYERADFITLVYLRGMQHDRVPTYGGFNADQ
ncbi:MAG: hypothetical protein OEQ18_13815, partial [Gammaproteobacteria bacterium]|nr:hypothetical protein [Gammaproteobacteria bacterium]